MNKQIGPNDGHQFRDRKAEVELQKTTSATSTTVKPNSQPSAASFSASRNLARVLISEIVVGARLARNRRMNGTQWPTPPNHREARRRSDHARHWSPPS